MEVVLDSCRGHKDPFMGGLLAGTGQLDSQMVPQLARTAAADVRSEDRRPSVYFIEHEGLRAVEPRIPQERVRGTAGRCVLARTDCA